MRKPECRRCQSSKLLLLDKKRATDNDVYRCRECGYLFSPPPPSAAPPPPPQTTAMESGYGANR